MTRRMLYIWLIIAWIVTIFIFSSQPGSISNNKSIKIANFVYNNLTKIEVSVDLDKSDYHYLVRKSAHVTEYFVLSILILGLLVYTGFSIKYKYIITFVLCNIISLLDEYNQTFVLGRDGNIGDVFIDNLGIILAIFLFVVTEQIRVFKNCRLHF